MRMVLEGWGNLRAHYNLHRQKWWLQSVANLSRRVFVEGIVSGPHTGRVYRRRGGLHQASAPGEFPANETGRLLSSLRTNTTANEAIIGTNTYYAHWLRNGSRRMQRRKMSDDALKAGRAGSVALARGIVHWKQ